MIPCTLVARADWSPRFVGHARLARAGDRAGRLRARQRRSGGDPMPLPRYERLGGGDGRVRRWLRRRSAPGRAAPIKSGSALPFTMRWTRGWVSSTCASARSNSRMRGFRFYFWAPGKEQGGRGRRRACRPPARTPPRSPRVSGRASVAVQGLLAAEVLLHDGRYLGTDAKGCGLLTRPWRRTCVPMATGIILAEWRRKATTPSPN